jgi:geranylgeranylglycerol-phosphate geranylgeranyltransferase
MGVVDYWRLPRGINVTMGALAVPAGALFVSDFSEPAAVHAVLLHALSVAAFMAGWNTLNDVNDVEADRINRPNRPIPSGSVSLESARRFGLLMMGISVAALVGIIIHAERTFDGLVWWDSIVIWLLALFLFTSYEYDGMPFTPCLKCQGFKGNLAISVLVSVLLVFGAASVGEGFEPLPWIVALAALAINTAREIIKDVQDLAGDADRTTLPMHIGPEQARTYAWVCSLLGMVFLVLPYGLEMLPKASVVLQLPALLSAILAKPKLVTGEDALASRHLKGALFLGLLGFMASVLLSDFF